MVNLSNQHISNVGSIKYSSQLDLSQLRNLYLGDRLSMNGLSSKGRPPVVSNIFFLDGVLSFHPAKKNFADVKQLRMNEQKRILVTGGAGFVGSHLVDRLMLMGHRVICLDNFFTGSQQNIDHWLGHPNFQLVRHDVIEPFMAEVDQIYHLACPASPPHYQSNPVKTIKTGFQGTYNMLGLAKRTKARFLLTSTSEIYGDPEIHPQREDYWGNVNPIGPRACYDEAKRIGETLTYAFAQQDGVDVRVVRIFNTFGPRMNPADGRVVSNFIIQALKGVPLTIYGDGAQTRSFQYVHDLVDGLIYAMNGNCTLPINLGNPHEFTIAEFASLVQKMVSDKDVVVERMPPVVDDPKKRRPDISRAKKEIDWEPRFSVEQGVAETIEYFRSIKDVL